MTCVTALVLKPALSIALTVMVWLPSLSILASKFTMAPAPSAPSREGIPLHVGARERAVLHIVGRGIEKQLLVPEERRSGHRCIDPH